MFSKYLILISLFFVILTIIQGIPVTNENDIKKLESCKTLCGHCDCTGYYCGDECICECNSKDDKGKKKKKTFKLI